MSVDKLVLVLWCNQLDLHLEGRPKAKVEMNLIDRITHIELVAEIKGEWTLLREDMALHDNFSETLKNSSTTTARHGWDCSLSPVILDASAAIDGMNITIALFRQKLGSALHSRLLQRLTFALRSRHFAQAPTLRILAAASR